MKKALLLVGLLVVAVVVGGAVAWFMPDAFSKLTGASGFSQAKEIKVEDFQLLDCAGGWHDLYRQTDSRAVVIISTANGCPASKEAVPKIRALRDKFASQGVVFWMLNSDPRQERAGIAKEAAELGLDMPVLEDRAQLVADALGITQTCEAICICPTN